MKLLKQCKKRMENEHLRKLLHTKTPTRRYTHTGTGPGDENPLFKIIIPKCINTQVQHVMNNPNHSLDYQPQFTSTQHYATH
jgi:hypothetical protein